MEEEDGEVDWVEVGEWAREAGGEAPCPAAS